MSRARVAGKSHAGIAGAVVGTIACDDPALWESARLPSELDRMLVRVSSG